MKKPIYLKRCGGPYMDKMVWTAWMVVTKEEFISAMEWVEEWHAKCEIGKVQTMLADEADGYYGGNLILGDKPPIRTFIFNDDFVLHGERHEPGHDVIGSYVENPNPDQRTLKFNL